MQTLIVIIIGLLAVINEIYKALFELNNITIEVNTDENPIEEDIICGATNLPCSNCMPYCNSKITKRKEEN